MERFENINLSRKDASWIKRYGFGKQIGGDVLAVADIYFKAFAMVALAPAIGGLGLGTAYSKMTTPTKADLKAEETRALAEETRQLTERLKTLDERPDPKKTSDLSWRGGFR